MRVLISALFIQDSYNNYGNGGSGKYFNHLIQGLREIGYEVIPVSKENINNYSGQTFDRIITSHQEINREIERCNIIGHHIHLMQGIVPPAENPFNGMKYDKLVSISEEVRNHALKKGFDSVVIHQPYIFDYIGKSDISKKFPLKILHIKGANCKGTFTKYSNKIYHIIESDQSVDIMRQIKEADMCLCIGRGVLDSVSCKKPLILGDNRNYIGEFGDGLLTSDILEESLKFNFNGKRFKNALIKPYIDLQVKNYLESYNNEVNELIYSKFVELFDYKKIASEIIKI